MKYQHFRDFDAFASSVKDVECTMMLQNPTHHSWSMNHVYLPKVHLQLGRLGSGNIVEGQSWSNGYVLYMPLTDTCQYLGNGTVVDKNSFLILEPGCEFCISTKVAHDWCSIFVPTHQLTLGSELVKPLSGSEKMRCRVTSPNPQLAAHVRALMHHNMAVASNLPEFESSLAATCAAAELLKVAPLVVGQRQGSKPKPGGRPKLPREEIIAISGIYLGIQNGSDNIGTSANTTDNKVTSSFCVKRGANDTAASSSIEITLVTAIKGTPTNLTPAYGLTLLWRS